VNFKQRELEKEKRRLKKVKNGFGNFFKTIVGSFCCLVAGGVRMGYFITVNK